MDITNAISIARLTDVGRVRKRNEDAVASDLTTGLVMVADGMGGYNGGEIASEMAAITVTAELAEMLYQQSLLKKKSLTVSAMLSKAVAKANHAVYQAAAEHTSCAGMGTTFVAGVFHDNQITVGHIGDSRLYRLRENNLEQLTEDHSLLQEQLNAGLITKAQAKTSKKGHLVTRALGTDSEVELELNSYQVKVDDLYLLCSDGLSDLVSDDEIRQQLLNTGNDVNQAVVNLVKLAIKHGGNDNISIVIALVNAEFKEKRSWIRKVLG